MLEHLKIYLHLLCAQEEEQVASKLRQLVANHGGRLDKTGDLLCEL
jgi:hypothetical protein